MRGGWRSSVTPPPSHRPGIPPPPRIPPPPIPSLIPPPNANQFRFQLDPLVPCLHPLLPCKSAGLSYGFLRPNPLVSPSLSSWPPSPLLLPIPIPSHPPPWPSTLKFDRAIRPILKSTCDKEPINMRKNHRHDVGHSLNSTGDMRPF